MTETKKEEKEVKETQPVEAVREYKEYIPGLAPSVPIDVDNPNSPQYVNPAASDMVHVSMIPPDEDAPKVVETSENKKVREAQEALNKAMGERDEKARLDALKIKEEAAKAYQEEKEAAYTERAKEEDRLAALRK